MTIQNWWKRKSGPAKLVTALSALLLLQIGLCWSTPAVLPWYFAVFGPSSDSEFGLGLMIVQGILCLVTCAVLLGMTVIWLANRGPQNNRPNGDPHDR